MSNPFQLTFTLKQHTPIIHFQYEQEGATLRATEVKPKLDRFIIMKLGNGDYKIGKTKALNEGLLIGNGDKPALNYKLAISIGKSLTKTDSESLKNFADTGLKGFFGNINKDETERKELISSDEIILTISSFIKPLRELVELGFHEFINTTNFGTRTTKGFGCFTDNENKFLPTEYYSFFNVEITSRNLNLFEQYKIVFERINLFYAALRSGINLKSPQYDQRREKKKDENGLQIFNDEYYFKSLAFFYSKEKLNSQWEKRTIKENFFNNDKTFTDRNTGTVTVKYYGLTTQQNKRRSPNDFPIAFSSNNKTLIKDLLGLSSQEAWLSYSNASITKTEASNHRTKVDKERKTIDRYRSPIQFKPIKIGNGYRVYLQIIDDLPLILNHWFCINSTNSVNDLFLKTPDSTEFSISKFFNFLFDKQEPIGNYLFEIDKHVESKFHRTQEHGDLKKIFNDIKANKS